jgi:transcriptional regulator with XRE-family HTH domain
MATKAPNPIDRHVGSRVRLRRMMLNMSQTKLGDELGLTFQQVQKYEKGKNRISASKLLQSAHILQVPVTYFFEGVSSTRLTARRLSFASLMRMNALMSASPSRVARKSDT